MLLLIAGSLLLVELGNGPGSTEGGPTPHAPSADSLSNPSLDIGGKLLRIRQCVLVDGQCNAVFRRTGVRVWLTGCAAGFALIATSGLFAGGRNGTEDPTVVQRAICLPIVLALAWTTLSVARQGIWLRPEGVHVRNVYRSYDLPWRQIESIDPPVAYGALRRAGIRFRLSDGRTVNASLYTAGPFNRVNFADDVVETLRQCHVRICAHLAAARH